MKKEELFETLSDLDPAMVKKARDYQRYQGAAWKKRPAAAACAEINGGAVLGVTTWRNGQESSAVRFPSWL